MKGKNYDIGIIKDGYKNKFIVTINVDNDKFANEDECRLIVKDLIEEIKDIKGISGLNFNFFAEGEMKYMLLIDNWEECKYDKDLLETIEFLDLSNLIN